MAKTNDRSLLFLTSVLASRTRPIWDSEWGKGSKTRFLVLIMITAAWFWVVLATTYHHEFWRDEVRALSIAIASPSVWDLPEFLKNEGHPMLWYALLHIGYQFIGSNSVLHVMSIFVAGSAVIIFLFRSPFSLVIKLLFIFSVLPLYEYSVMARNYGISMLLMFCIASIYPHRRRFTIVLAIFLALLANTNLHSFVVAGILTVIWFWDDAVDDRQKLSTRELIRLGLAFALIAAAAIFAAKVALPDERTIVAPVLHAGNYLALIISTLLSPWKPINELMPVSARFLSSGQWQLLQTLLIGLLVLGLTQRVRLACGLLAAFLLFGFLINFVHVSQIRHQGILFIFIITLYWINAGRGQFYCTPLRARFNTFALVIVLPLLLLWCDGMAYNIVRHDFKQELSSCKAFGVWIKSRPEYKDAIILSEPDYCLEALPYYATQKIFIPRESQYRNWVKFTTESRPVMHLGELLDSAQGLKEEKKRRILLALGFRAGKFDQQSYEIYSYNKRLVWTPLEWQRFKSGTKKMAGFWSSTSDENFDIYEVQ